MIDSQRSVRQRCDVCEAEARYCPGAVVVIGQVPERGLLVAQCPQCQQFICSEHAKRAVCQMAPEAMEAFRHLIQETGFLPTVLCCPWHGVPLGQFRDWYVVVGNATPKASEASQHYARTYVQDPKRYIQSLSGFDLSQRRLASPEALAWPIEESYQSSLLERLQAGQRTFAASGAPRACDDTSDIEPTALKHLRQRI